MMWNTRTDSEGRPILEIDLSNGGRLGLAALVLSLLINAGSWVWGVSQLSSAVEQNRRQTRENTQRVTNIRATQQEQSLDISVLQTEVEVIEEDVLDLQNYHHVPGS